jgi:hypothetical protein
MKSTEGENGENIVKSQIVADLISILILVISAPLGVFFLISSSSATAAAFWWSFFASTAMYKVLEIKDPQGLEFKDWTIPFLGGVKASAKMTGALATFGIVFLLVGSGLTFEQMRKEANAEKILTIDDSTNTDDYSVLFKPDSSQNPQVVGKIQLYNQLLKLKEDRAFSDVLKKIQADCPDPDEGERQGLCGIPYSFDFKIVLISQNVSEGQAAVCGMYKDLVGQSYKISPIGNINKDTPTVIKITSTINSKHCGKALSPILGLVVGAKTGQKLRAADPELDKLYHAKIDNISDG